MLPSGLPILFRKAGLNIVVVDGWQARGRPGSFGPVGVLNHHTGASAKRWTRAQELSYAKWMFLVGRPDLPAPLCQIALGRSGTVYVGAAGRANHAGTATSSGSVAAGDGNTLYVGIEWMLSGIEAIPTEMMAAGVTLNAVLTELVTKTSVDSISCHYQTSVTGKWDIGDPGGILFRGHRVLDVKKFRRSVAVERKLLYHTPPGPKRLNVAVINAPIKVGADNWAKCWNRAHANSAVFGINESLTKKQRDVYRVQMAKSPKPVGQFGLHQTPNPIFWRKDRFRKLSGKVHQIHPSNTGPLADKYPGFNAARYITEVVLLQKVDKREFTILNTHLVPNGPKVNDKWRKKARRKSKRDLRQLVRKHKKAGREVIVMGDMNLYKPFKMPPGFKWIRKFGIDKIGSTLPGTASLFEAPTDHKHGVKATLRLRNTDK